MEGDAEARYIDIFNTIFELSLTRKDIKDLKPDLVQKIYTLFLKDFGANVIAMQQFPHGTSDNVLANQEMYQSTFNILALSKTIQHYIKILYHEDGFYLSDLIQPNRNRTFRFFEKFIDFYSYLNDKLPSLNQVEAEVMSKKEKKNQLISCIDNYKTLRQKKLLENAEVETALEEEIRAMKISTTEMESARDTKEQLKSRLEEMKEEIHSQKVNIKQQELCLLQCKEEHSALESLCVTEAEKNQIREMEGEVNVREDSLQNIKDALRDNKKNLELLLRAEEIISKSLLPLITEIEEEANKIPINNSSLRDSVKKLSDILEEDMELMRTLQNHNEGIASLQEKLSTLQHSSELKRAGFMEELKQVKLTLKELSQGNEENNIIIDDLKKEIENNRLKVIQEGDSLLNCKKELKLWLVRLSAIVKKRENDRNSRNEIELKKLREQM